jgi:hypothetical protein
VQVAGEEHVHVHPYPAVVPEQEEAERVAVDPPPWIVDGPHAPVEVGPDSELGQVGLPHLEHFPPLLEEGPDVRVLPERCGAVRPEDQFGSGVRLRREERLDRRRLPRAEGPQVRAPVRVVQQVALARALHGGREVVAAHAPAEGEARGEEVGDVACGIVLGRRGREAALEGADGVELGAHPAAGEDGELDLEFVRGYDVPYSPQKKEEGGGGEREAPPRGGRAREGKREEGVAPPLVQREVAAAGLAAAFGGRGDGARGLLAEHGLGVVGGRGAV